MMDVAVDSTLFTRHRPLIDLRAPIEFAQGAFASAINLPLMSDEERAQVGLCYKEQGQSAAIALGHRLVSGALREARIEAWLTQIRQHPDTLLYCFRGGLRSQTVQAWLAERGCHVPRVVGGYKALRQFLLTTLEQTPTRMPLWVVTGTTGSGKTQLLQQLRNAVDLEALAHHRGSSFGALPEGQPGQINFENALATTLLERQEAGVSHLVLEDESRMIGRCTLPLSLFAAMSGAPMVQLEAPLAERVERIRADYVDGMWQRYLALCSEPDAARQALSDFLRHSLCRLEQRLGNQQCRELLSLLDEALHYQFSHGDTCLHHRWIERLLGHYYDPVYLKFMHARAERCRFRGTMAECLAFLQHQAGA